MSIGSTLESITIGHNPSKMGLCHDCVFLPGKRKDFYCEHALKREVERDADTDTDTDTDTHADRHRQRYADTQTQTDKT